MLDDIYDLLSIIRTFIYGDGVRTDNFVFRILTKQTALVFFVCFLVNVFCLCFSNPISCISDKEVKDVIDTFCWIKAMYTLPTKPEKDLVLHEGVRPQEPSDQLLVHHFYQFVYIILALQTCAFYLPRLLWNGLFENGRMNSYKEFLLKISALTAEFEEEETFCNTKDDTNEGSSWGNDVVDGQDSNLYKDLLQELVKDSVDSRMISYKDLLDQINPLMSELYEEKMGAQRNILAIEENTARNERKEMNKEISLTPRKLARSKQKERKKTNREINMGKMANYLYDQFHHYNFYAYRFVLCEFLAVINILVNIYIMNLYLGKTYLTYGMDLLLKYSFEEESWSRNYPTMMYFSRSNNITSQIFPKVTKCTMTVTGPGGNLVPFDALCVLSINIANEMIYFALWWWLVYILCMSAVGIVYRIIFICSANLRLKRIQRYLIQEKIEKLPTHTKFHFELLTKEIKFSDWFVLWLVKKNSDRVTFTEIIIEMAKQAVEACDEKKKENLSLLKTEEVHSFQDDPTGRRDHRYAEDYVDHSYSDQNKSSRFHYRKPRGTLLHKESEDVLHECHALINISDSSV